MSAFTKFASWRHFGDTDYRLTADLKWYVGKANSGLNIIVPAGFPFNVSIPLLIAATFNFAAIRFVCILLFGHPLFDPNDRRYLPAAALHDWWLAKGWDRVEGGAVFRTALLACGVGRVETFLMWMAVSLYKYGSAAKEEGDSAIL